MNIRRNLNVAALVMSWFLLSNLYLTLVYICDEGVGAKHVGGGMVCAAGVARADSATGSGASSGLRAATASKSTRATSAARRSARSPG